MLIEKLCILLRCRIFAMLSTSSSFPNAHITRIKLCSRFAFARALCDATDRFEILAFSMRRNLNSNHSHCDALGQSLRKTIVLRQCLDFALFTASVAISQERRTARNIRTCFQHRADVALIVLHIACERCAIIVAHPGSAHLINLIVDDTFRFDAFSAALGCNRLIFFALCGKMLSQKIKV